VHLRAQGFEAADLDTLGAAWLVALDEVLGDRFDHDAREQWLRFYKVLRAAFLGSAEAS
jgi:hemoglobin-like flavoprotein